MCVDRNWAPGGGVDGKGGGAEYVLAKFPEATLGEPTDGMCSGFGGLPPRQRPRR